MKPGPSHHYVWGRSGTREYFCRSPTWRTGISDSPMFRRDQWSYFSLQAERLMTKCLFCLQRTVRNIGKYLLEDVHWESNTVVEVPGKDMKGTHTFLTLPFVHPNELTQHVYICYSTGSSWKCWCLPDTLSWKSIIPITTPALPSSVRLHPRPPPSPLQAWSSPMHGSVGSS